MVYTNNKGEKQTILVFNFKSPGVALAMYNTDESIEAFAHSSFQVIMIYLFHIFVLKYVPKILDFHWRVVIEGTSKF